MGFLLCAEFPCDNPALFESCEIADVVEVAAAEVANDLEEVVSAITAPRESGIIAIVREEIPETFSIEASDEVDEADESIVVEEIEIPSVVSLEGSTDTSETMLPPPPDDPFLVLVNALSDVVVSEGQPLLAASIAPMLLEGQGLDGAADAVRRGWRAILDGSSDDFDACGGAMLDEWCAGMLARLLGTPARTDALRKELRTRGVAAFGLAA